MRCAKAFKILCPNCKIFGSSVTGQHTLSYLEEYDSLGWPFKKSSSLVLVMVVHRVAKFEIFVPLLYFHLVENFSSRFGHQFKTFFYYGDENTLSTNLIAFKLFQDLKNRFA